MDNFIVIKITYIFYLFDDKNNHYSIKNKSSAIKSNKIYDSTPKN